MKLRSRKSKGIAAPSLVLVALLVLAGALAGCSSNNAADTCGATGILASAHNKAADLRSTLRSLWMYHGWYTRAVVVAAALNSPNLDAGLAALLKTQEDMG